MFTEEYAVRLAYLTARQMERRQAQGWAFAGPWPELYDANVSCQTVSQR